MTWKPDLFFSINYNLEVDKFKVYTNIKEEFKDTQIEILHQSIGALNEDNERVNERQNFFEIAVGLCMDNDSVRIAPINFHNNDLAAGIIGNLIHQISEDKIEYVERTEDLRFVEEKEQVDAGSVQASVGS